jgi:lactate 2-monooxygenase
LSDIEKHDGEAPAATYQNSLGATAVGLGRPYAYALSYGGTESLTHYLKSFLAELDLCLAICGFKDIASLKEAGSEEALTFR